MVKQQVSRRLHYAFLGRVFPLFLALLLVGLSEKADAQGSLIARDILVITGVFAIALMIRMMGMTGNALLWTKLFAIVALAPPLVWAGYQFLYDQEREPLLTLLLHLDQLGRPLLG